MPVTTVINVVTAPVTQPRDAYQLAVVDGFTGTREEWYVSLGNAPSTTTGEPDKLAMHGATGNITLDSATLDLYGGSTIRLGYDTETEHGQILIGREPLEDGDAFQVDFQAKDGVVALLSDIPDNEFPDYEVRNDLSQITSPIALVAMAGDSHMNMNTTLTQTSGVIDPHVAFDICGTTALRLVGPNGRTRDTHAIGGSTVTLFLDGHVAAGAGAGTIVQKMELLTQLGDGEIDTVILSLGTNDLISDPDPTDALDRLDDEFVTPFLAAGGVVILCDIPPCRDNYTVSGEYHNRVRNSMVWNAAMRAKFADRENVGFYSCAWMFREGSSGNRVSDQWLGDGTHLLPVAQIREGIDIIERISPLSVTTPGPGYTTEFVNANPYLINGGAGPLALDLTVEYQDRTDGETGEREFVIRVPKTYERVGAANGNGSVRFTFHSGYGLSSKYATFEMLIDPAMVGISVEILNDCSMNIIRVRVPGSDFVTATKTANEVIAVINSSPAVAFGVASTDGTGNGTAVVTFGHQSRYIVSNALATADALAVSNGDMLRGYCEVLPVNGHPLNMAYLSGTLYANAGSAGNKAISLAQSPLTANRYPLPADGVFRVVTPWYTVASSANQFTYWLNVRGQDTFRLRRFGVQRKVITP